MAHMVVVCRKDNAEERLDPNAVIEGTAQPKGCPCGHIARVVSRLIKANQTRYQLAKAG